jgi:hypothetical protein
MNKEFKEIKLENTTRYVLETADAGVTGSTSIASIEQPIGELQKREAPKPRNFVAKNAKMGGAGQHKDKKKSVKQGDTKHKKSPIDMHEGSWDSTRYPSRRIPAMSNDEIAARNAEIENNKEKYAAQYKIDPNDPYFVGKVLRAQEKEKRDSDYAAAQASQAQQQAAQQQQSLEADRKNLPELMKQYQELVAKFKSLGGTSYQYADTMMPQDYEAKSVHDQLLRLQHRINKAGGWKEKVSEKITVVDDPAKATGVQTTNGITHGSVHRPSNKPAQKPSQQPAKPASALNRIRAKMGKGVAEGMSKDEADRIQALYDKLEWMEERYGWDDPRVKALKDQIRGVSDEYRVIGQNTANSLTGVAEADEWEEDTEKWERFQQYAIDKLIKTPPLGPERGSIAAQLSNQESKIFGHPIIGTHIENMPFGSIKKELPYTKYIYSILQDLIDGKLSGDHEQTQQAWQGTPEGKAFLSNAKEQLTAAAKEGDDELKNVAISLSKQQVKQFGSRISAYILRPGAAKDEDYMTAEIQKMYSSLKKKPTAYGGGGYASDDEPSTPAPVVTRPQLAAPNKPPQLGYKPGRNDVTDVDHRMKEGFDGEYDDEAGMAHSNLLTSARAVMGLLKTIEDRDNLPEWAQEKIAKAEMMLVGVWDYLQSQKEQGIDPKMHESAPKGWEGTVKAMKKHKEIDNPYALTHWMKNKGYKSHKKESVDPYFESLTAKLENHRKK